MKSKGPKKEIVLNLASAESPDRTLLGRVKREVAKKYGIDFPANKDLLATYRKMVGEGRVEKSKRLVRTLLTKPVRSLSGIVNVTVLTKPAPCPGECIFCPSQKGFPQSYLSGEPAADRAEGLSFDPHLQVNRRLSALKAQGHPTAKIELRIVGGTWSAYSLPYRRSFLKSCFKAANDFPRKESSPADQSLTRLQAENEKAEQRIVGLSIETRPDRVDREEIRHLRRMGVTMVEMGVQTLFDQVHARCRTGLTRKEIVRATKLLKEAGFKVLYQMMPDLPGSSPKKDRKMFNLLFQDPRFKPDWLKIYPCLVCKGAPLYEEGARKQWQPCSKEELLTLLAKIKKELPPWVRVARIFRDIPAGKIEGGVTASNIREVVQRRMARQGDFCSCVRCREVRSRFDPGEELKLKRRDYRASKGKEIFLSFENREETKIFSLLRLRIPENPFLEALRRGGIIRELQTFGPAVPPGEKGKSPQHKGLGSRLIREAERITKEEFGLSKMTVISGAGARNYYRKKHGYHLKATYMTKRLRPERPE